MKNKKNIFYILIMAMAFYFRLKGYLFDRALWMDECSLFNNVYELNYSDFFKQLRYAQTAPPLFLVIEKFITSIFGAKEMVIRILPFVTSIIAIPVFYKFSKLFLKKRLSIIVANLLFAVNFQLIFYSQEFKQYSTDVLLVMVLFLLLCNIKINGISKKQAIFYSIVTPIFPLISIPTYFVTAGWFLREIVYCTKKDLLKFFIIQIPLFITTVLYYFVTLRPQREDLFTHAGEMWYSGFITVNLENNFKIIIDNLNFFFDPCKHYIAVFIILIVGLMFLIKQYKKKYNLFLICTLYSVIICSALRLYPIKERVALYLIPLFIVIIAKSFDLLSFKRKMYSFIMVLIFLYAFGNYNIGYLNKCNNNEFWRYQLIHPNILMQELKKLYKPNDVVFISWPSLSEYQYYKVYYNFKPTREVIIPSDVSEHRYQNILTNLTKTSNRCWFFYSNELRWLPYIFGATNLRRWKNKNNNYVTLYEYKIGISYLLYLKK